MREFFKKLVPFRVYNMFYLLQIYLCRNRKVHIPKTSFYLTALHEITIEPVQF